MDYKGTPDLLFSVVENWVNENINIVIDRNFIDNMITTNVVILFQSIVLILFMHIPTFSPARDPKWLSLI